MRPAIKAYQGKEFTVILGSQVADTNYGWCLTSMPDAIALASICFEPNAKTSFGGPVDQVFTFIALGQNSGEIEFLEFQEICFHDTRETGKSVKIAVNIIPYNDTVSAGDNLDDFIEYSENSAKLVSAVSNIRVAYGIPSLSVDTEVTIEKYGVPCIEKTLPLDKYGVPCVVKYGVSCSEKESPLVKYGSPCSEEPDPLVKYGVPCSEEPDPLVKYGIPCGN